MKHLLTIFILITFLACSSRQQSESKIEDSIQIAIDSNLQNKQSSQIDTMAIDSDTTSDGYQTSTYDNNLSEGVMVDKEGLKGLSDKKVFSTIHDTLLLAISKKHHDYLIKCVIMSCYLLQQEIYFKATKKIMLLLFTIKKI